MTFLQPIPTPELAMSDEQATLLRRLCAEADAPFDPSLCARRASRRIEALIEDIRLSVLPPHTD
jgi:hypothetical protein